MNQNQDWPLYGPFMVREAYYLLRQLHPFLERNPAAFPAAPV
jgi:hypothetical protein